MNRTERNLEFHRLIASGVSKAAARRQLGYHPKTPVRMRQDLLDELEKSGITERRVAKKLKEGLEAHRNDGSADHGNRVKYLKLISHIKGYVLPPQINFNLGLSQYHVVADSTKVEEALKIIDAEIVCREEQLERHPVDGVLENVDSQGAPASPAVAIPEAGLL